MSYSTEELVKRAKIGDEDAISKIITMYKKLVFSIIYKFTNNYETSLELCQDTFFKCFRSISKLKDVSNFKSWLCNIAINLSRNELKRMKKESYIKKFQIVSTFVYGKNNLKKTMLINEALSKLKDRDREILILFYYKGFTLKEISNLCGIKEGNIKMILFRARALLRNKLEALGYEFLS